MKKISIIPIEVSGHSAYITRITTSTIVSELAVIIELIPPVGGLKSFSVGIPAKEYTKEELTKIVVKKAEQYLQHDMEKREQKARQRRQHERTKKLAEKVSKAVGLA